MAEQAPRKSLRVRKLTTKAIENEYVKNLARSGFVAVTESSSDDEEFLKVLEENKLMTPSVLQNTDSIQGDKIFQFQSRKTKHMLLQRVKESKEVANQRTPQHVRSKIKREVEHKIESATESEEDPYSTSGSEYEAEHHSNTESDSDDSSKSENSSSSESYKIKRSCQRTNRDITVGKIGKLNSTAAMKTRNSKKYTIKTDEYFFNQASKKIITSNHTLDNLETPRLAQDQLHKLLKNMELSENHKYCMKKLYERNKELFSKWLLVLQENFNILLYGLGSKMNIINDFRNVFLQNSPVIVVNGFFPSLSIKDVLDGILIDLLELKRNSSNVYECCDIIEQEFSHLQDTHLYLIVHNIDGEMLRNSKAQNVLARLANVENIHLIASIDHINGPLMWDHSKLSKFNYTWWDMTSFLPYLEETSFESSTMIQKSGEFALSSLRNVFLSLTTNSKGIYSLIVKYQLQNSKSQFYQGLAFKDLYSSCREAFLVSSDLALRAQLTEFIDHKMVKLKRSVDGVEYLVIPISNALLQKFLDEQDKS